MIERGSLKYRALYKARVLAFRAGFDVNRAAFLEFVQQMAHHDVGAVLDIGANVGQFGQMLRQAKFGGRIHSVEPQGSAFAQLSATSAGDPQWTVQRAAVSAEPGTLTLNVAGNSVSSSVLPMLDKHVTAAPEAQYVQQETVPATTVDEIVAAQGLDPERTVLKIDVQGYERQVLDGAAKTLPSFRGVRTEMSLVALYEGQALMDEIAELICRHGFELWLIEPGFHDPHSRRLLQLDGVYFRD